MSFNKVRDFIFEEYYKRIGISKKNSYYLIKRLKRKIYCCLQTSEKQRKKTKKKIPDPRNVKEHYQSFIRKKHNINKTNKNDYLSTKNF